MNPLLFIINYLASCNYACNLSQYVVKCKKRKLRKDILPEKGAVLMTVDIIKSNEVHNFGKKEQDEISSFVSGISNSMDADVFVDLEDIILDLIAVFNDSTKSKRFNLFRKERSSDLESQVMELVGKLEASNLNVFNNVQEIEKKLTDNSLILEQLQERMLEGKQFIDALINENKEDSDGFEADVERFENVLHSLEESSSVATQIMADVQSVITSDKVLVRKIKFTIQNTIPLWRNSILDKRISNSYAADFVIKELNAVLVKCQNNMKARKLFQETSV